MTFLIAAYAVLWIGVFAYVLRLAARVRELHEEAWRLGRPAASTSAAATTAPERHPLEPSAPASGPVPPRAAEPPRP